ncbi:MAG: HIT domain-containing protein [Chloroflexota bacterium]|nr:HIT domain-containing protein [Chloroflexota bacterium]
MGASREGWDHPAMRPGVACQFCRIVAGESPARIVHEDDDVIVIHNVLDWVPVMLLAMPRRHMTQEEMWRDPVMARVAEAAVRAGKEHCPRGFRLLSNFGPEAMQSQPHAHLHVLGGTQMGRYV